MSSPRRLSSRRLPSPPKPRPTDPGLVPTSRSTITETPQRRPIPQSNASAGSASSVGSLSENETIFDVNRSSSQTPTSPLTPGETPPNPLSRLLFGNEAVNRSSVESLGEPPFDHETPEQRLYDILSEESRHDTPSKRNDRQSRTPSTSFAPSTATPVRPILHRQPEIDDVSGQQSNVPRIPGTFESQNTDTDMGDEWSAFYPDAPSADESAQHTDEAHRILGEFAEVPIVALLIPRVHQLRPADWQTLKTIFKEHKKARFDLKHLIHVLGIRIRNRASDANPLEVPETTQQDDEEDEEEEEQEKEEEGEDSALKFEEWNPRKPTRQLNNSIFRLFKSMKTPVKEPDFGWIYVFESPNDAPGHVKIGKTSRDPQVRQAEWAMCGLELLEVEDSDRNAFAHHSVVESVIKFELHNQRRKYKCYHVHHAHKEWVEHEEWFEIDKQRALKSIRRWRDWIKCKGTLDDSGLLTPYWHWRVQKLPKIINDVDWDKWTQPSLLDYIDYQLEEFGKGYYARIKAHLGRKDFHFCLTGGMMIFILHTQFGLAGATWGLLGLLIL